jgi:carbon storage regulator CsrA
MLVLSRKLNEKIFFPGTDTVVQVLGVRGSVVRIGVQAPPEVAVFREELWQRDCRGQATGTLLADSTARARLREINHLLRNRLNATTIGLALLRQQVQMGLHRHANATLDRLEQEFATLRQETERIADQVVSPPPARACRALVVEDDGNERELLAGFLRLAGLDVATAGDGADALDYLRCRGRPDVLLLDMMMPRCDGPTTVRTIRHNPDYAGMKIYAVSGHTPEHFGLDEKESGIDRWFRKPVDPQALLLDLRREVAAPA